MDGSNRLFYCLGARAGAFFLSVGVFMANTSAKLLRAKQTKNDEFYTQYNDIKSELEGEKYEEQTDQE